ncbi:Integrase catalytic core protein [Phytophthora palmivora]|uniref:Integrase catalytic core protein n=1 Tax=Phytophthora palmivora TaxID=4796 RepID=A0A2P4YMB1_9STRA|nr:Integrase catalytic core protein [Phytophthora palmivora]
MNRDQLIYMRQPPGYHVTGEEVLVCGLQKSISGLKQVSRFAYCIYVQNLRVEWVIMVIYVDELTIMSKRMRLINKIKAELSMRFKMKDLGNISYILKMEITRNRVDKTMSISQHRYIVYLLKKYNIENSSVVATPQVTGLELKPETKMTAEQIAAQKFDYRGLVESLQYLVRGTRPDIANAVRELSKYLSCYNRSHREAARRVLKYLKGTSTYGLLLDGKSREVMYEVYTGASFACQSKERKSITGYCNSKQGSVSLSTTEAELIALSEGAKESEWLWHLLSEMSFPQMKPVQVWCDGRLAISITKKTGTIKLVTILR